jgi:hypothetical protein
LVSFLPHAAGLHFFDLTAQHTLPPLPEWNEKTERLPKIRERYEKLSAGGHALRIALDKLQTLDLVRIIDGKPAGTPEEIKIVEGAQK